MKMKFSKGLCKRKDSLFMYLSFFMLLWISCLPYTAWINVSLSLYSRQILKHKECSQRLLYINIYLFIFFLALLNYLKNKKINDYYGSRHRLWNVQISKQLVFLKQFHPLILSNKLIPALESNYFMWIKLYTSKTDWNILQ